MSGLRPIGESVRAIICRLREDRQRTFPRSEFGRRQLHAHIDLHGGCLTERAGRINWDLDPHMWALRHEIEVAERVACGLRDSADIQAAE